VLFRFPGERSQNADKPGFDEFRFLQQTMALSRDGRTVAVSELDQDSGFDSLIAIDTRAGKLMGRQALISSDSLGWTRSGRLMFRRGHGIAAQVIELDRSLRPVAWRPAGDSEHMAVIGDDAVTYGRVRMTAYPTHGVARPAQELRLAGTLALVELPALGSRTFAPPEPTYPKAPAEPPPAHAPAADGRALAAWLAAALILAGMTYRRTRHRRL
jgi:hypothetical protein